MYAIFEDGGKQYKAVEGATIEVDRFPAEEGDSIDLERVLLVADGDEVKVGTPVELTFRRLHEAGGNRNYFWKARPA